MEFLPRNVGEIIERDAKIKPIKRSHRLSKAESMKISSVLDNPAHCKETDPDKCKKCFKCWVGRVLAEEDSRTECAGCKAISPVLDISKPCPCCGACGSLAWAGVGK